MIIVVTGASSGIGALAARALARAGHTVYAGMRDTGGHNAPRVDAAAAFAEEHHADLRSVELDVSSQDSADDAIASIVEAHGRLDVVVHNAGHMVLGPAEAFTPEQLAQLYDTNAIGTQRVNRAALPHLRARRDGLLVWVSSSSVRGGTPPYLAPYFAAKAAMDSLAVSYAAEVARFGIDTTIVVPGAFTSGTNHFPNSGHPADEAVAQAYEEHYAGLTDHVAAKLAEITPADADVATVAAELARVVDLPKGQRPFRVHIDPADDGGWLVAEVGDRIRSEFLRRIDLADLLSPAAG
ncbi:SDR family NAD(P)-dependent oxidoreductase [Amycolatopsis sp. NBC_00438]|uniref:SDR family NAD(P)-dependent oxidoreductase n=1 Tax=Amycolatopsis sp. NBC_00438 TaxID=2903558 RepID=UPI002E1F71A9